MKKLPKRLLSVGILLLVIIPTISRINNPGLSELQVLYNCRMSMMLGGLCVIGGRLLR